MRLSGLNVHLSRNCVHKAVARTMSKFVGALPLTDYGTQERIVKDSGLTFARIAREARSALRDAP